MAYPFTIVQDTVYQLGEHDTNYSPRFMYGVQHRYPSFFGEDGNEYQISYKPGAFGGYELLQLDRTALTRTAQTITNTYLAAQVLSVSGLTQVPDPFAAAVLGNFNRVIFISPGAVHPSTFSIWKVNSSGNLVCESAIQYDHVSSTFYFMGSHLGTYITGNQTADDPIYACYWSGSVAYLRGWRLPSLNQFAALNGTRLTNGTEIDNNNADFSDGDALIMQNLNSFGSARRFERFGWMLPNASGQGRWYFYIGPGDVYSNSLGAFASPGPPYTPASPFIASSAAALGDQFVGYIDLGNSAYNTSSKWTPGTTKVATVTTLQTADGNPVLPFILHKADGYSYDSAAKSDFYPGPTVKKLSNGTYLVIFASFLHSDLYGGGGMLPLCRYMAYIYTPATEVHVLVASGTFQPFPDGDGLSTGETFSGQEVAVEYDETTNRFYYHLNVVVPTSGTGENIRDFWGVVLPPNDGFILNSPSFLQETDVTYKDFTDRYPI